MALKKTLKVTYNHSSTDLSRGNDKRTYREISVLLRELKGLV